MSKWEGSKLETSTWDETTLIFFKYISVFLAIIAISTANEKILLYYGG